MQVNPLFLIFDEEIGTAKIWWSQYLFVTSHP